MSVPVGGLGFFLNTTTAMVAIGRAEILPISSFLIYKPKGKKLKKNRKII